MKSLYLKRCLTCDGATFGVLIVGGRPFGVTLEPRWNDNKKGASCIPAGSYSVAWKESPRFGRSLQVQNVVGRSHILIHAGNFVENTSGCILVGLEFSRIDEKAAVLDSKAALERLRSYCEGSEEIILTIVR